MKRRILAGMALVGLLFCAAEWSGGAAATNDLSSTESSRQSSGQEGETARPGEPGYLGIVASDAVPAGGAIVVDVTRGSPAAQGGLLVGDRIESINRRAIREMRDVGRLLTGATAGTRLDVVVSRGGVQKSLAIVLGRRPPADKKRLEQLDSPSPAASLPAEALQRVEGPAFARLGVGTMRLTPDAQRQFNLATATGALVTTVTPGSPADTARIPIGSAIVAVDDRPVRTPQELGEIIEGVELGKEIELTFAHGGGESRATLRLRAASTGPAQANTRLRSLQPLENRGAAPERPESAASPDGASLAELERRVRQLEDRIASLEAAIERAMQGESAGDLADPQE